jgi:chemotaxis protein methyltransferase CheR
MLNYIDANLTDREYNELAEYIYDYCGIALGDNKHHLVKARLMKRLNHYGFKTFREYFAYVTSAEGRHEIEELVNRISTNTTQFFREPQHFEYLRKTVLPKVVERMHKTKEKRFRMWCAASSSGEEPYCLLMTVLENLPADCSVDFKILATDISTKVLKEAIEGVYSDERMKPVPSELKTKYFEPVIHKGIPSQRFKDEYRHHVVFRQFNLMTSQFPFQGKFDVIFCRNVMIYFDRPTQHELASKFFRFLQPGGYLFIGHSESLIGHEEKFKRTIPACFRKD